MTKEDIKTIIDIVHETIYGFFDVCDEEETPMTDKDKLLLKINKAICTNIKALEQEPCGETVSLEAFKQVKWERDIAIEQLKELGYGFGQKIESSGDVISRQAVLELIADYDLSMGQVVKGIHALPSVTPQEPKTGHWIRHDNGKYHWYLCSCCDAMAGSDEKMMAYKYCPNCGAKMVEE